MFWSNLENVRQYHHHQLHSRILHVLNSKVCMKTSYSFILNTREIVNKFVGNCNNYPRIKPFIIEYLKFWDNQVKVTREVNKIKDFDVSLGNMCYDITLEKFMDENPHLHDQELSCLEMIKDIHEFRVIELKIMNQYNIIKKQFKIESMNPRILEPFFVDKPAYFESYQHIIAYHRPEIECTEREFAVLLARCRATWSKKNSRKKQLSERFVKYVIDEAEKASDPRINDFQRFTD